MAWIDETIRLMAHESAYVYNLVNLLSKRLTFRIVMTMKAVN